MRLKQLDFLRSVAIFLVLFRHIMVPTDTELLFPVAYLRSIGWAGVDLFFVLSGFLVSGLLFRELQKTDRIDFKQFYLRRSFKIIPSFYFLLLAYLIINQVLDLRIGYYGWKSVLSELAFVQNYKGGLFTHTWSLAVEEHFYLILPALVFFSYKRLGANSFPYVFVFFIIVVVFLRNVAIVSDAPSFAFRTHKRIDSLFIGVLVSYLYSYKQEVFRAYVLQYKWPIISVSFILLGIFLSFEYKEEINLRIGLDLIALSFAGLLSTLLFSSFPNENKILNTISFVGVYSYNIYLWHDVVNHFVYKYFFLTDRIGFVPYILLYFGGSLVVGIIFTKLIEIPAIKWRDILFPKRYEA